MQENSIHASVAICYINHAFTSGLFSIGNDIYDNWIFGDSLSYFFPDCGQRWESLITVKTGLPYAGIYSHPRVIPSLHGRDSAMLFMFKDASYG